MMLQGLMGQGVGNGGFQPGLICAPPQQRAQVHAGIILQTGFQKTGGRQAHPVAALAELMAHRGDGADFALETGRGALVARPRAGGGRTGQERPKGSFQPGADLLLRAAGQGPAQPDGH